MAFSRYKLHAPQSCDTFAVLPPVCSEFVVFGKNSDRPSGEVQEVVHAKSHDYPEGAKVQCTYIEIDQVAHTHEVILSKPAWMWGAEMGANEHGVCIGNEAVWTKVQGSPDSTERLLGMDLLRLGLERATTALEAVHVITNLLETHGQGGNCSDSIPDFTYHNSFLIADPAEVWILETAKKLWAAEHIKSSVRNISNELSIGTNIDLVSSHVKQYAEENGLWNPSDGPLNFKKVFGFDDDDESYRYKAGKRLLTTMSASGKFNETNMFKVLRDKPSGICMSEGSFVSTSSQVSVLRTKDSGKPCCHWFTGTSDPSRSIFKPFIFVEDVEFPAEVISPVVTPVSSGSTSDRRHELYKLHEVVNKDRKQRDAMNQKKMELENSLLERVKDIDQNFSSHCSGARNLFKIAVESEISLYKYKTIKMTHN